MLVCNVQERSQEDRSRQEEVVVSGNPPDRAGDRQTGYPAGSKEYSMVQSLPLDLKPEDLKGMEESGLSPEHVKMLRFEGTPFKNQHLKDQVARDQFDPDTSRYYQVLNGLLDNPGAYTHNNGEFAPVLNRLSRIRDKKTRRS